MPSPFPGMNPYFEQSHLWREFHQNFLVYLQRALNDRLMPRYTVDLEVALFIDRVDDRQPLFAVADAAVAEPDNPGEGGAGATVAVAAPMTTTVPIPRPVRRRRRWLTVRDTDRRRVVTVVELLSPSDKRPGKDRIRYIEKRTRVFESAANLIEIDLLRGGQRMPVEDPPACDYCVLVSRRPERPRVGLWPFRLADPLPRIPIPLRPGEAEPQVDLRDVLDATYDGSGAARKLYRGQPDPPLSAADAEWARQFLPPA